MRILFTALLFIVSIVAAIGQRSSNAGSEGMSFFVQSDVLIVNKTKFTKLYLFDASSWGKPAKYKHFRTAMGANHDRVVKDRVVPRPVSFVAKCYDQKGMHIDLMRRPNKLRLLSIYFLDKSGNALFDNTLWIGDYLVDSSFRYENIADIKGVAYKSELGNFITLGHENKVKKGLDIIFEFTENGALESVSVYISELVFKGTI
jgi:acyl-CoA-binding protein